MVTRGGKDRGGEEGRELAGLLVVLIIVLGTVTVRVTRGVGGDLEIDCCNVGQLGCG